MIELRGDLFDHVAGWDPASPLCIAHIVNDVGAWGAGFSGQLTGRYALARGFYQQWHLGHRKPFVLGNIQVVDTFGKEHRYVANMLAQHGIGRQQQRVDYAALDTCLYRLARWTTQHGIDVMMPMIGAGLGGGDWSVIKPLIDAHLPQALIVRR